MLYRGTRLFIPPRLRQEAFRINHGDNHSGIQSSIRRMKISTWWPSMESDIERMVKQCPSCRKCRFQGEQSVHKWPEATPFQRIHIDWADVSGVGTVLIIVDSGTGWIEAFLTSNRSSETVIKCLRNVFSRFGTPETLVSDNGKEFVSRDLNCWLKRQGVNKMESPPYFPRSNGLAERAVRTVKTALSSWKESVYHNDFNAFLQRVLFHHSLFVLSRKISCRASVRPTIACSCRVSISTG